MDTKSRQELLDYIAILEAKNSLLEEKVKDLTEKLSVFEADLSEFQVSDLGEPSLSLSDQTADALAEASALFGGTPALSEESELPEEDFIVEPAPVENGVVKLSPVKETETYIPVRKQTVKVRVKRKTQ